MDMKEHAIFGLKVVVAVVVAMYIFKWMEKQTTKSVAAPAPSTVMPTATEAATI